MGSQLGWWLAGGMLILIVMVLAYPLLNQEEVALDPPTTTSPFGNAGGVDLGSMTPREAADQLFDRVMRVAQAGDTTQVGFFVPMAIQAYQNAEPLDADGLFHLAYLQRTGGLFEAAIETTDRGLAEAPDHLLLLYTKAEAQLEAGDREAGVATFERLLEVWEAEMATVNPDYEAHSEMLPSARTRAESVVQGG